MIKFLLVIAAVIGHSAAARAEMMLGANGHPIVSYPGIAYDQQIKLLADLGLKSYRVDIKSAEQGDALAKLVQIAKEKNIQILPVVTPAFDLKKTDTSVLYRKSFDMARSLVSRFKADIRVWELGNEMENEALLEPCERRDDGSQYPCDWGTASGNDPLDYHGGRWAKVSAVLKGLSDGAAAADSGVRRAMGTAGWGHIGAFQRMKDDRIDWDISVWHIYGEDPEWAFRKLAEYGHPIWVTEYNAPRGSEKGDSFQAAGLRTMTQRLRDLSETYKIEAAHIYELLDEPYYGDTFEAKMGLVRIEGFGKRWRIGGPKEAYAAVLELTGAEGVGVTQATAVSREAADETARKSVSRECVLSRNADAKGETAGRSRVIYAYCLLLGRRADGAGLASYARRLSDGSSIDNILLDIANSPEFAQKTGISSSSAPDFTATLYRVLLDRAVDEDGFKTYVWRLDRGLMTRPMLIRDILQSNEFKTRHGMLFGGTNGGVGESFRPAPLDVAEAWRTCSLKDLAQNEPRTELQIAYSYCLVLGRLPDAAGAEAYAVWVRNGSHLQDLLVALADSEEFQSRASGQSADAAATIGVLYALLLERTPDDNELSMLTGEIKRGDRSIADLVRTVISTPEFRDRQPFLFPKS